MTITLKKNSVDVRIELRRNDTDFIGMTALTTLTFSAKPAASALPK